MLGVDETSWLLHVDVFIEVAIQICILEVDLMQFKVMNSRESQYKTKQRGTSSMS
jgi:hypothetical protein